MNEWITNRLPKLEEATNEGDVWVYDIEADEYYIRNYEEVIKGQPWMEIPPPEPYVKPKRFRVEYFEYDEEKESGRFSPGCYIMVTDFIDDDIIYNKTPLPYLTNRDAHRKAAEEITAIYERTMQ